MAKHNLIKRVRRIITGLTFTWKDEQPEAATKAPTHAIVVSHRKPQLKEMAKSLFNELSYHIYNTWDFYWHVKADTVFVYPNGTEQRETTELSAFTKLANLNNLILEEILKDRKYGEHYCHVEFQVECKDFKPPKLAQAA